MLRYLICLTTLLFCLELPAQTQTFKLSGRIVDSTNNTGLISATVVLRSLRDSTQRQGAATDADGNFTISGINPGGYSMRVVYIGYKTYQRRVFLRDKDMNLGTVQLSPSALNMKEVTVEGKQVRAKQMGDTTQYNADAFKTHKDASAEDLVSKMPGITNEGGSIKARGEDVKQVLVDGKPFFGDDPNAALKNLPAEVIDKVQVYDKMSDQSRFTGFNDGNTTKTINIVTKPGRNNGQFGKLYAGYGTDDRYSAGGNLNYFKGNRRISLIGMSNNVNQQNFSTEDLLGVLGGSSQRGAGYGGGRPGMMPGRPMQYGYGGAMGNFMVGQQGGISTTHAIGLNFSDSLGHKVFLSGSYFFNNATNVNSSMLSRSYYNTNLYNENSSATSHNLNHRINLRFEYNIDSMNSLVFTPRVSFQGNNYTSLLLGKQTSPLSSTESRTNTNYTNDNSGYTASGSLLLQHKFAKKGRTISISLDGDGNNKTGNGLLKSQIDSFKLGEHDSSLLSQRTDTKSNGYTASTNLSYTEPLGKDGQLQLSYNPSISRNNSDKRTYDNGELLNALLSNTYDNYFLTQKAGISYRLKFKKGDMMAGTDYKNTLLQGNQSFPMAGHTSRTFDNLLPTVTMTWKFSDRSSIRTYYRTSASLPSVQQLQNALNNTNPLLLTTGNPNLGQDYTHMLFTRYSYTNTQTSHNFFLFAHASYTMDYIGNAVYTDTTIDGIRLGRGVQLTRPENIKDGSYTARSFMTYGLPAGFMKSNLNLNAGISYSRLPGLVNGKTNFANTVTYSPGLVLSSNVSDKFDFAISYYANYNTIANSLQRQSNSNYFYHTAGLRFNWTLDPEKMAFLPKFSNGFVLSTDVTNVLYTGLGAGYDQDYVLWNAYIGKKLFKSQSGELRISAYDLLNQNKSISRNVTETYVEDIQTQVLHRYFMASFVYSLRAFKAKK